MNTKASIYTYVTALSAQWVRFGPHFSDGEARRAFQQAYGYWPDNPVKVEHHN